MTVLTKPSMMIRKADAMTDPLVLEEVCEEKVNIDDPAPTVIRSSKKSPLTLLFISSIAIMVGIAGLTCGLMVYKQYLKSNNRYHRFCYVPVDMPEYFLDDDQFSDPEAYVATEVPQPTPSHEEGWGTLEWFEDNRFNLDSALTKFSLQEELDIGDSMEKIKVKSKDKSITYIHDFDSNITGIIDPERCFMMPLDNNNLLTPDVFVISIENKDPFDLSLVRNTLYAALPALSQMFENNLFGDNCDDKPVYQLKRQSKSVIRKRSADLPPASYVHFAGKGIQEVEISNMKDLLAYEKGHA